jgi:hypothetical protein
VLIFWLPGCGRRIGQLKLCSNWYPQTFQFHNLDSPAFRVSNFLESAVVQYTWTYYARIMSATRVQTLQTLPWARQRRLCACQSEGALVILAGAGTSAAIRSPRSSRTLPGGSGELVWPARHKSLLHQCASLVIVERIVRSYCSWQVPGIDGSARLGIR